MRLHWRVSRYQRKEHVHGPMRKQKTTGRARRCQQNALGQQLANQPETATPERKADGDFRLTYSCTGKQQIAHIRARYQQHHGDDREQDGAVVGSIRTATRKSLPHRQRARHATGRCRVGGRRSISSLLCSSKTAAAPRWWTPALERALPRETTGPSTRANIRRYVPDTRGAVQSAAERRGASRNPATGGCVRQRIPEV